ncbi:MAG: gliding motility-associated C-terminal domain-containing protein [Bacteroidia bacterium]|nr:gliding motility-associated C-terminal domain-containing protein [Bacteroidia bacterium]
MTLCILHSAVALNSPVNIQRACLDKVTSTLTVYFKPNLSDPCGSFSEYVLYGRDNSANPFTAVATASNLAALQIQVVLPNKKRWELYISSRYACNGIDTLNSDTILIDDEPPAYLEPDSVSVDLATQQLIAGWPKAVEPDVMGYSLFKNDPGTGNNILIDRQNVLGYTFGLGTFDPSKSTNRFLMAAYDSCDNGGPISQYHNPILSSFNSGQNIDYQCTRKLYLIWTAYVGWNVDSYDICVKDNISNTWSIAGTVPGAQFNYTFNIPSLGPTYTFFIRGHKTGSTVSSSSNSISFTTINFTKPSIANIRRVTVINDQTINVPAEWENTPSIKDVLLQRKPYGTFIWTTIATYNGILGAANYTDQNKSANTNKYDYRLLLINSCNEPFDSSTVHTNILLRRNFNDFYWNQYWAWVGGNYTQDLIKRDRQGFTWNSENTHPDSSYFIADTTKPLCYRILSVKYGVNNKPVDTAYSNELCLKAFDTTLIPGGFTPGGLNPIFKIINVNILPGEATMRIYDRWGAKITETDALTGWDGKDQDGNFLGPGIYAYTIQIVRTEKRELLKGTVVLIR